MELVFFNLNQPLLLFYFIFSDPTEVGEEKNRKHPCFREIVHVGEHS